MPEAGPADDTPPLAAVLAKKNATGVTAVHERRSRECATRQKTPCSIRNMLLAQNDGNAAIVLAGPATGLVRLLDALRRASADFRQGAAARRRGGVVSGRLGRSQRSPTMSQRRGSCLPSGRRRSSPWARKSARRCRIRARASRRISRGRRRIRSSTPIAPSSRCRTTRADRARRRAVRRASRRRLFQTVRAGHDHASSTTAERSSRRRRPARIDI